MAKRPTGITIIAILYFLGFIVAVLVALAGAAFSSVFTIALGPLGSLLGAVFAVVFGIIGVVALAAGYGLWKSRKWGFYLAIVLQSIGVLSGLFTLMTNVGSGLVNLIISGLIFYYIWTKKALFR